MEVCISGVSNANASHPVTVLSSLSAAHVNEAVPPLLLLIDLPICFGVAAGAGLVSMLLLVSVFGMVSFDTLGC